jgi:hypothetical protein
MKNRRNHYRILHVQPEAPLEVIKASYRSMMTKLRHHPDLGGDHETAVLINQAYAVLSDPEKRKQYDQGLHQIKLHAGLRARHASTADARVNSGQGRGTTHASASSTGQKPPGYSPGSGCLFCGANIIDAIHSGMRCSQCNSPLVPASNLKITAKRELFGRRTVPRVSRNEFITAYPSWPHQGFNAKLRDVSPVGISFISSLAARTDQVIKVSGAAFDGVVRVVSVRPGANLHSVHALFLTLMLTSQAGSFVSMKV